MMKILTLPYFIICFPLTVVLLLLFHLIIRVLYPLAIVFEIWETGKTCSWNDYLKVLGEFIVEMEN